MNSAWENLNFPSLSNPCELGLAICTLEFRLQLPFDVCVFLSLQAGQISVSFIDDQGLTGCGCACLADVHLYVTFNWPQSTTNQ